MLDIVFLALSKQEIMGNPLQYILLVTLEGSKMFFWESTQVGFVTYPVGLAKLFAWLPFRSGLRLAMAFLTFLAFVYLGVLLWQGRRNILKDENSFLFPYLCLLFIFSFVGSYSLFGIIVRYLLPIAPLYLIIITYVLQKVYFRIPKSR
jgi:hypothetical protein